MYPSARFIKLDICDMERVKAVFKCKRFDVVVHLAAQAGVRYSITNPHEYITNNIQGFLNILEACRAVPPCHLVYASSSSVYGLCRDQPFAESSDAEYPVSLYAASKRSNELMAHTYAHLYNIPSTGLRFFTVYGPWGRPDMAPFIFTKNIYEGKPISVFNNGNMKRDFTYIDDIIEGIVRVISCIPKKDTAGAAECTAVYNIGNGEPVALMDFIRSIEEELGKKAIIQYTGMQPGDVPSTWADCTALRHLTGFKPQTKIADGVKHFAAWYMNFIETVAKLQFSTANIPGKCFGSL
jgi:UDP-glucuronate 4-epimerase